MLVCKQLVFSYFCCIHLGKFVCFSGFKSCNSFPDVENLVFAAISQLTAGSYLPRWSLQLVNNPKVCFSPFPVLDIISFEIHSQVHHL